MRCRAVGRSQSWCCRATVGMQCIGWDWRAGQFQCNLCAQCMHHQDLTAGAIDCDTLCKVPYFILFITLHRLGKNIKFCHYSWYWFFFLMVILAQHLLYFIFYIIISDYIRYFRSGKTSAFDRNSETLLHCPFMSPKWFWTVQIILVEYQMFWSVRIILDRSKYAQSLLIRRHT